MAWSANIESGFNFIDCGNNKPPLFDFGGLGWAGLGENDANYRWLINHLKSVEN